MPVQGEELEEEVLEEEQTGSRRRLLVQLEFLLCKGRQLVSDLIKTGGKVLLTALLGVTGRTRFTSRGSSYTTRGNQFQTVQTLTKAPPLLLLSPPPRSSCSSCRRPPSGIMFPSLSSLPYLLSFQVLCTWWAWSGQVPPLLFRGVSMASLLYSSFHFLLVYIYQLPSLQEAWPPNTTSAR